MLLNFTYMKNIFFLLSFLLFSNISFSQGGFTYKRQLITKQCKNCDCINYRKYKIISKLNGNKLNCAEVDCRQDETLWWVFRNSECKNYCSHDFSTIYGDNENREIKNCVSEQQKKNQEELRKKEDERDQAILERINKENKEKLKGETN